MVNFKKWCLAYVLLVMMSFTFPSCVAASQFKNLSIIVPSCDKYGEAWSPFFTLLFKYWPENTQNIYLISNEKTYTHTRVKPVLIKNEKSWSDNMLFALEQIPEDYVMIILEDFFIKRPVNHQKLVELFETMKKEKAAYLELRTTSPVEKNHPKVAGLGFKAKNAPYRTSLQVCIWDKKILKSLLRSGESAWSFELAGTERSRELTQTFMSVTGSSPAPISYIGAISRGYWDRKALAFLEKEGIELKPKLPVSGPFRDWVNGSFRNFVSKYLVQPVKNVFGLKQVLPETTW